MRRVPLGKGGATPCRDVKPGRYCNQHRNIYVEKYSSLCKVLFQACIYFIIHLAANLRRVESGVVRGHTPYIFIISDIISKNYVFFMALFFILIVSHEKI